MRLAPSSFTGFLPIKKWKAKAAPAEKVAQAAGPGGGAPAMRVNGIVLKPQQFANTLSVTGSIEANEQVEIRGEISGLVRSISFQEGSTVSKGQVLLKIDDSELRAQLAQAQTKQQLAAENERRAGLLLEKEAISREEYDVARADLKTAQAQTQLIRAQLAKTTIKAPFSGQIGLRNISEGGFLIAGYRGGQPGEHRSGKDYVLRSGKIFEPGKSQYRNHVYSCRLS